ncbi:hypothetical protein BG011_007527 [Mortierella polycephala]|uniref:RPEL repeat protein n=1 Tax=Mortierella polycephala TaxID=41804 RepID=A0A9P6PRX5_9FUNG|nr:hypothetical protein BG011_007527 [Mortierella polycephala]
MCSVKERLHVTKGLSHTSRCTVKPTGKWMVAHDVAMAIKARIYDGTSHDRHQHIRTTDELDHFLQERPPAEELVEKNILKGTNVEPALQQENEEIKKAQLEDALNTKLEHRPPASELLDHNILHESRVAPGLQQKEEELKRTQLEHTLNSKLEHRPSPETLIEKHIL